MNKKVPGFLFFLIVSHTLQAQNVGIGDPAPSARLTVSGSETTPTGQAATIKLVNTASTNTWFLRAGANGTTTPVNGFSIADNSGYHLNISAGGNTGLGINPATARLHVNGMVKIEGLNHLEFGAGIAGKELNAGKIGYNAFGTNALAIVGAGTNSTNRAVYFFAEDGTTFNGPINVLGNIRVNGNSGSAGQVLTSNGTANATWANTAYSNNTRFKVIFNSFSSGASLMSIAVTEYNLNATDIGIGIGSIAINKTGLYRINGVILGDALYPAGPPPAWEPELVAAIELSGSMIDIFYLANYDHFARRNSVTNPVYYFMRNFSVDMHLQAGTVLNVSKILGTNGAPSSVTTTVHLYGNLISE